MSRHTSDPETPEQAVKRAAKARQMIEGEKAAAAYAAEGDSLRANMHRLRALRLAKEAAEPVDPPKPVKARGKKK